MRAITPPVLLAAALLIACAGGADHQGVHPVPLDDPRVDAWLEPLGRAIGDRRIVLLGENGHGVGELTTAKVRIIEWLHRGLGFDLVVLESGFFECGLAWRRAAQLDARQLLYDCLRFPFQQAEILPLFQLVEARRGTDMPLELAGMDPQPQGFDSSDRPRVLHAPLSRVAPDLARRVAAFDSALFLVPDSGGVSGAVYDWVADHGPAARAAYDSAAARTDGWVRWSFLLAGGLLDRLEARARAEAAGATEPPAAYYQLRDEWMARAIAALADSIAGPRRVVVWLHNDHARYGTFAAGPHRVRSVGGFLRDWYGDQVFSVGFFMGRGRIADNARRVRRIEPMSPDGIESRLAAAGHPAGYLVLSGNTDPGVRAWADAVRPYLRMGTTPMALVPAREFDALFYIDSVAPPRYEIPR